MFQLQKWRFPGLGGQGVAVAMRAAVGPIETIDSVAKVEVSRPGWPGCCCSSNEVGGFSPNRKVLNGKRTRVPCLTQIKEVATTVTDLV